MSGGFGFGSLGDSRPVKPKTAILEWRKRFPQRDKAFLIISSTLCSPASLILRAALTTLMLPRLLVPLIAMLLAIASLATKDLGIPKLSVPDCLHRLRASE